MSKTKECFAYNTKIIETPTTKEVYIYENPIFIYSKEKADLTDTSNRKKFDEMSAHKQYDSLKRKQKHYEQARWDIARIVDCNFDNKTKFVTLTFKENIQEILITNREFKYFIQRLNYYLYHTKTQLLKYLATWENEKAQNTFKEAVTKTEDAKITLAQAKALNNTFDKCVRD